MKATCEQCNGFGAVDLADGAATQCPECDGAGQVEIVAAEHEDAARLVLVAMSAAVFFIIGVVIVIAVSGCNHYTAGRLVP